MALRRGVEETGSLVQCPDALKYCDVAILKVTAAWCGPCNKVHPDFVRLCKASPAVTPYTLDIDAARTESSDTQALLEALDVSALPTFIAFRGGVEIGRVKGTGAIDLSNLFDLARCPRSLPPETLTR